MPTFISCRALLVRCAWLVVLMAMAGPVAAHKVGISRGEYRAEGSSLRADLMFARPELASTVPGLDTNGDGTVSAGELASGQAALVSTVVAGLQVSSGTERCRGELEHAELVANDGVALHLHYLCTAAPAAFHVRMPMLAELSVGHRHLAEVEATAPTGAPASTQVVYESSPEFEIGAQPAMAGNQLAGSLFLMGIEHILTGFDHLMFLFGVVLVAGRLRTLLLAVTAFTLAHSVTLGIATLGYWAPSPSVVEPAIALSIVYVGVENWFVRDASRRWMLTFPFGLIHGFGFAGALKEIALPTAQVPIALVSFNLGVEAGQILVLALVLPILFWLRRRPWFERQGVRSASSLVAVSGLVWFFQRVAWAF
ncbi:MAG TPA: HupE/UreJ family protein [Xanthomonadaceae bacterium]|jgi:hydrogenase/urease accessory protein HupE